MAGRNLEAITVDTWLKDLRMECYKRNLEEYPNVQVCSNSYCICNCQ